MASIFELVNSEDIVAYWRERSNETENLLGEELFDERQKLGLDLKWIKGSKGLPVVLKPSAYDVVALKRDRIGFEKIATEMPFFKESMMVDEELRQQLNMVLETGNQAYIDSIMTRVFDDEISLLRGARAQRERMRMMLITTGGISISANGQNYDYDYGLQDWQSVTVTKSWSDPTATIMEDIRKGIQKIVDDTGVTPERATCSSKVFGYFRINNEIKSSINVLNNGEGFISDARIKQFILDELGLQIVVNDKRYKDEAGTAQRYVADDVFVMFPAGQLGNTWFGTTPEESDLMTGSVANVTITDTGVAVTTIQKADPVTVETKVTMICLPDFPTADQVYIADVITG